VPSLDVKVADALGSLGASTTSPDSVYRRLVSDLGIAAQSTGTRLTTQTGIAASIDNAASSVAGVSIDEEMTNIITFQRAYEAAGRMLTAVDSALDTLINHTGLVGRA
jgi:flagellar hook-associated protein 1 FlgK